MAEFILKHDITDSRGSSGGGQSKSAGINEDKIAAKIGKVYEKIAKSTNTSLQKNLDKSLDKILTKLVREMIKTQPGSGTGVSEQSIKRIVQDAAKTISIDAGNALLKELQKIKPGQTGNSKELENIMKSVDRRIGGMVGAVNTALSKAGVELSPQGVNILSKAIGASLRGVVSKEFGSAMRDFNSTAESLVRGLDATTKALSSFSKLKKSGGGIDVKEAPQAIKAVGEVFKEFKNVKNDFGALSQSTKDLVKDQKALMKEIADSIAEMKRSFSQKVSAVTSTPPKIVDAKIWQKVANDFLKRYERITKSIKLDAPAAAAARGPAKEIKQLDTTLKDTGKNIVKAVERVYKDTKSVTTTTTRSDDTGKVLKASFREIVKLLNDIRKDYRTELGNITSEVKAGTKDKSVLASFSDDFNTLIKAVERLQPTEIKEAAGRGAATGANSKKLDQLRGLINEVQKKVNKPPQESDKEITAGLREASKKLSGAAEAMEELTKQPPKVPTKTASTGQPSSDLSPLIKNIQLMNSKLRGPSSVNVYPEVALPATKGGLDLKFEGSAGKGQEKQKQLIQARINDLSSSLFDLQDYIVTTINEEFKDAGNRWSIVSDGTEKGIQDFFKLVKGGNLKESGKQHAFQIANVDAISKQLFLKGRGASAKGTPASMVRDLTDAIATELASNFSNPADVTGKIAEWLKGVTKEQIKQIKEIERFQNDFIALKDIDSKGVLPSKELVKKLSETLGGSDKATLEAVFKATVGKAEASKTLSEQKLVRTVSLPAAKLTKSGTPVFETSKGSQRALQRFAKFKTGFEQLYEDLAEQQSLIYSKGFADRIKSVGVKPKGLQLDEAQTLSEEIITDFAKANKDNLIKVRDHINKAAQIKYVALGPKGGDALLDKVKSALVANAESLASNLDPNAIKDSVEPLIKNIKDAGLSMYDIVKSMDKIKFLNVYDVMKQVLEGVEGGLEPLKGLGQKPGFDKYIREFEKAQSQVVQTLPLIESGRPRRGFQQENVLNLLTRSSDIYSGENRLKPEQQKDFIKDLNVRFNEMIKESSITNKILQADGTTTNVKKGIIEEGVRTISSLGIPESLAGKVEIYRPGKGGPGTEYLGALDAFSTKMYTDILPELAPFGAQFTQLGRNVAGVTNAMSSSKAELDRLSQEFKSTTLEGFGTEFPGLRTERESDLISSGRLGTKGFGFNVLTELRHTAGTMEDQILVSGNMAKALTSVTKTLVRPSPRGRIGGELETAVGVGEVQTGVIKDKDISNVLDKIQEVLGVPEQYKGRADQAFIDEVRRAITVVRGEEVEVQQARITEVFLNSFGRKLTSRFGSKGVSVTPGGLGQEEVSEIGNILKAFPTAKVKVLTEEERGAAGLGVAVLPRSMGELLAEVLDKYQKKLETEGFDVSNIKKMLLASGNKFVFELFKDASKGLVVEEEAAQQQGTFQKASEIFKSISGRELSGDKSAIQEIRNLFKKEIGGGTFKERAIDVRISSVGIGKRGLQPEVLESIVSNIASVGERGFTTIPTRLGKESYEGLLGGEGKAGELSQISKALGFKTAGTKEQISQFALDLGERKGTGKDNKALIAQRAAALESMSNYYTTIIDESGDERKSIVGEKFLSIVQDPGETEPWKKTDVRRGLKGASVDIPVFSAYATVFGEQSSLIKEISESTNANQRKQLELLKALQFMADETGTLQDRELQFLDRASVNAVKYFDAATGTLGKMGDDSAESELDPRSLKDTIFDVKKFSKPFFLDIPKAQGEPGETEPIYVPGALARGTYSEELVAGERGVEATGRKLQHLVNMAKKATELLDRPAAIQEEIENLEKELAGLLEVGDPKAAKVDTKLQSRRAAQTRLLSGEGELSKTVIREVTKEVGDLLKESQKLKYDATPDANSRVKDIYSIITNALSKTEAPTEAFKVKRFGEGQQPLGIGASEAENVEAFLERQKGIAGKSETAAYVESIGKAADLLIGKGPGAVDIYNTILKGIAEIHQGKVENISMFREVLEKDPFFKKQLAPDSSNILELLQKKKGFMAKEMKATEDKLFRLSSDIQGGEGLNLASKLGIDVDRELQFKYENALDNLTTAKVEYFHSLAEAAVGKEGAIGTAVFSRKFPAVMKKATNAIVDRTQEFTKFKDTLKQIKASLPETAVPAIDKVISEIGTISSEHGKKIAKRRKAGFPVLRQHELGIPEITAKKLPVDFEKKIQFGKKGPRVESGKIEGTLFDLLSYRDRLLELVGDGGDLAELAEQELERTRTFVEAIRYPFTGVSSIVPYEPKLLKGKKFDKSFVVPGAPELDIEKVGKTISPIQGIISDLSEQRESLFREADVTRQPADTAKIEELTRLMDKLAQAVAEVTPKYAAHTAKLDFDGDEIAVHTARTREAREEIRAHHKSISEFGKGYQTNLQAVYRDVFTSDALKSQQPTGDLILAEQAEAFYKKFPAEKGFDYLVKPFLTGQASLDSADPEGSALTTPTLEYAGKGEQLSILGLGDGITKTLKNIIQDTVQGPQKGDLLGKIEPFTELEGSLKGVKEAGGIEGRVNFVEDIYKAIEDLDDELSTNFVDEIKRAVTSRLFESKYRDAVEAQLFKIHTGIETEALYRLNRLAESNVGFGGGFVGPGAAPKPSAGFSRRNPSLDILGGDVKTVSDDFFAKFNEVFRFALQKGMDVKHAGGQTIAGVIERNIAGAGEGITGLWDSIIDTNDETFGELRDFSDVIDKTSKVRLGELPTDEIRKELVQLYEARGKEYGTGERAELATSDRKKIIEKAVEATGLKSFFEEMSVQVREAAIEGIIKQVSEFSPEKRSRIGDPETYAKGLLSEEIGSGTGINVREHVTVPNLPLYTVRQESGLYKQEQRFKEKYGDVGVPEDLKFFKKGQKETEGVLNRFKQAKATAQNIQDAIEESAKGLGGGAYAELVKSTLDNIHRDQKLIERDFKALQTEGFTAVDTNAKDYLNKLAARVSDTKDKDIPKITEDILKLGPEAQAKELERLADLVGIPTITKEEKVDLSTGLLKGFRTEGEAIHSKTPGLSLDDINEKAAEYALKLTDAATVVYEMDRILDVLATRAQEGITLLSLFPEPSTTIKAPGAKPKKSYNFAGEMKNLADQGQAAKEIREGLYGPGKGGTILGGSGGGGVGGSFPMTGGVVPVRIHSIAQGIGLTFTGAGGGAVSGAGIALNPEFGPQIQAQAEVAELRDQTDQHGEASIKKLQAKLKSKFKQKASGFDRHADKFDDEKFSELKTKYFPGTDPNDYEAFKKQFFTNLLKVFTGSKFKGGGADVKELLNDRRFESQVDAMVEQILGTGDEITESTQAAFDIGTALHEKMQRKIKDAADAAGHGDEVEIEKFVHLDPSKFVEGVKGSITGFVDVAYKDAQGQVEKISDIKTTGETFAKFENISKAIGPKGTIELSEILNKKIPANIRQKLEDYRSQLNVYLGSLVQSGQAAPGIQASIDFIPSEDTELTTPAKSVTFGFDPDRLTSDLEALKIARGIVTDYVQNLDVALSDVPEDIRPLVEKYRKTGKSSAKPARNLESFLFEEELDKVIGVTELTDSFIDEYVDLSRKVFKFMEGKQGVYTETRENFKKSAALAKEAGQASTEDPIYGKVDSSQFDTSGGGPLPGGPSKEKVKSFVEPIKKQFQAIQELHDGSVILQAELSGLDFVGDLDKMHADIKAVLGKGKKPPTGPQFAEVVSALTEGDYVSFQESMKAWKLWRISTGDFLIQQAREAEQVFDLANLKGPATREFSDFKQTIERLVGDEGFIRKSLGKKSDIYTKDRRFLLPDKADEAGVFASSEEIYRKSAQPFGEDDEATRGIYKDLKDRLESGTLGAPADTIRDLVEQMANLDREAQAVLEDVTLFERMGKDATNAWDFETMAKRARVLREALSQYSKFNLSDEFQTDVEKKFQVRSLLQYLKQIEQVYGRIDLGKLQRGPLGEYETGAVKVPSFLPPTQQAGLHRRNVQKFREFAQRPSPESDTPDTGPRVGESFSYFEKVVDSAGNVLKSVRHDFKKFGDTTDETAGKVNNFTQETVDLIDKMHMSGGTFRSATRRVVMWGAAATLVYGGVEALKDSLGEISDIEIGLAQLRMVMNPLETDFDSLTKSAVGFAKSYGVGVREVIGSMKIFAQQGLKQSEVIDRARVSTLASNVTTLSAADSTEALTAAMKVFGNELGSADMALDAWSETEARHAITAADMANAIKKSAAAAKNAGFTFNELNGIVAGIGAVTRQTGKEVGTAMRFIARRIFSEKGPKSLAEINIPTITGTGENRRGFDVLSDLSMKWDELTNAQKLNTAQALGGTRQYNALLVAMDNWDEVLEAIEDSTNSKGSAERRNVEIMKTYAKQLAQTQAAAAELKIQLGGFVFPIFKTGLKALKILFEIMSSIPAPVKAAGAALTLFFGYASKGFAIFDKLSDILGQGKGAIASFVGSVTKEFDMAKFEIFGKGFGPDIKGLKTFAKGASEALKSTGLSDLHSGFGKLTFVIKDAGDAYNEFLASAGQGADKAGSGIEKFGKKIKDVSGIVDSITDVFQLAGISTAPWVSAGTQIVESLAKGTGLAIEKSGQLFGASGRKIAEFMSDVDPSLFKSIAPLAVTLGTAIVALRGVAGGMDRARKSAQEYAQSVYNARRIEEDQIKELTNATRQYDRLEQRLKKINKVIVTPGLKGKQQSSDNYTAPLLALSSVQGDATSLANELAQINNKLVIGYDEQGDAILRLTGNYKSYIESLQRASSLELAKTDIDVLKKYVEALTDTGLGETIKRTLKTALGEVPGFGGALENLITVSPGKEVEVITGELNDLLSLREKYPLSDAFDQDISKLQDALGKVKKIYDETATDFKRTLAGIFKFQGAQGLDRDTIARLLADPELKKGFELLIEIEPKISEVNKARLTDKVKPEDVIGSEILKRIFPEKKAFIDYTSELTSAQLESSGILAREGKKVAGGDIVTFFPELSKQYNIAGAQAVVELKKTTDGVYEAFITYINSKTLEVEERALDDPELMNMVDRIFPSGRIQSELENRLDALNTFVAGAAAGLVGIEPKKFKKDFDLGARFYSDLPTTTALQADKGFNVQTGQFGALPKLQQEWGRMTKDFFIEPMGKYNREVQSLTKLTLDGLDDSAKLSRQKADELYDQQAILRNNQVVTQFAAVFADLSKSMEESSRALKENLAVETARQEAVRTTTGLLKGVPEGFDAIDTGIRKIQDLSVKQLAAATNPQYRELAGAARTQQVTREGAIGDLEALERTRVAIETIFATQGGLGSIAGSEPKAVEGFIQKATAIQDIGMATLSQDINNLDATSTQGFGDVVSRLETMIANQGDLTGFEEMVNAFEQEASSKDTGASFANELAKQLHKTAEARTSAQGKGDAQAAAVFNNQIDRLIDVMLREQGLKGGLDALRGPVGFFGRPKSEGSGISESEFQQRAFRGLQPNELLERFKTEGRAPGIFGALKPFQSNKEFDRVISGDSFADSDEFKKLIKLQEEANKAGEKSLLNSKTILKGSVAIATFEAFNKKHSSKVLDNLNEQLSGEQEALSTAKGTPGADVTEIEKSVASLKKAISDQEANLKFHSLVSSLTKTTGATTALGKVLGVSETNLKRANIGAVGLYVAMQAASKVTGKDLPESAKEFGVVLKEAVGELQKGGELKDVGKKLRSAGAKFEEAYGERVKEATGKTREAIDKQINERLKGLKDLSDAEITERAKQLRSQASSEGGSQVEALLLALAASTVAGTLYETSGRGTANAELERLAEKTSDVFNKVVEKYPEAADMIAKELVKQVQEQAKDAGAAAADASPQNQLLDVTNEYNRALEFLDENIEKSKKTIEETSKAFDELATEMAKFEKIVEINKSMRDFVGSLQDTFIELESQRRYGGAGTLNANLVGSPGDAALPLQTRQMSTQQRLFSTMGGDFQDSVVSYSQGLQAVNALVSRHADLIKRRREFTENNEDDFKVWQALEKEINVTEESIETATESLRPFGEGLSQISQYGEAINKLNDSLNDVAAKQAVDTLPGFRQYRDDMDKLLGGSHPEAAIGITPEQERMGRGVGVELRQGVSNRYDLEEARLKDQSKRSSGQESLNIKQKLYDLEETKRRDIESYRQKTETGRLKEQQAPFEQVLVDVQTLRQRGNLTDEVDEELREYQDRVVKFLQDSAERVPRAQLFQEVLDAAGAGKITEQQKKSELGRIVESGPNQFRGTLVPGQAELAKQGTEIYEQLRRELPTEEMSDLKVAVAEPIVRELERQTEILQALATEGLDVDKDIFDRFQKPRAERLFDVPERKGFFGRAGQRVSDKFSDSLEAIKPSVPKFLTNLGEKLFGFESGGKVFGEGGPKEDKVPAMLSPGEFVVRQAAASKLGLSNLEHINKYGEIPKLADGGFPTNKPASYLKTSPVERLEEQTWQDNLRDNPAWQTLMEITGIAPSFRLTKQIKDLGSVVLRPQTAFEWADRAAGMATNTLETALAAVDLAGVTGAISNTVRRTVGGLFTKAPKGPAEEILDLKKLQELGQAKEIDSSKGNFVNVIKNIPPIDRKLDTTINSLAGDLTQDPKLAHAMAKFIGEDVDLLDAGAEAVVFTNKKKDFVYRVGIDEVLSHHGAGNLKELPEFAESASSKVMGKYHISKNKFVGDVGKINTLDFEKEFDKLPNVIRNPYDDSGYIARNTETRDWYSLNDLHPGNFGRDKKTGKIKITDPGTYTKLNREGKAISEYEDLLRNKPKVQKRVPAFSMGGMMKRRRFADGGDVPDYIKRLSDTYNIPSKNLSLRGLDEDDAQRFALAMDDYLGNNPIAAEGLKSGKLSLGTATKKQFTAAGVGDAAAFYESDTGQVVLNTFPWADTEFLDIANDLGMVTKKRSLELAAPFTPKAGEKDPYGYLIAHEFGHAQDSLMRSALDNYLENSPGATFNGLPDYVKDMRMVMNDLSQNRNSVSGYAKEEFRTEGTTAGLAENFADIEAISELGNNNKKISSLVSAYSKAFSKDNQEKFLEDFGSYFGGRHDLNSFTSYGMGGLAKKRHFAEGGGGILKDFMKPYKPKVSDMYGKEIAGEQLSQMESQFTPGETAGLISPALDPTAMFGASLSRLLIKGLPAALSTVGTQSGVRFARDNTAASLKLYESTNPLFRKSLVGRLTTKMGYADGGPVRKFTTVNGQLVELDEEGNIVGGLGDQTVGTQRDSFLKNKAYRVGEGEVDINLSKPNSTALFAEEVASVTGSRLGEEANTLHRAKQKLSEEEIMAAEIAKINRDVRGQKEEDPATRDALRFPGLRGDTGELGLSNLTFDKKRGLVGDESIGKKFQSFYDLREMDFQDMKRKIDDGQIPDASIMAKIQAKARGMAATAGDDPATKAALNKAAIEKKALRSRVLDIQPGDKLAKEAGLHYGRETELLLPIYHKLKAIVEQDKSTDAGVLRQYDQAASLLGKDSITDPADMAILGQLVGADKKGAFMRAKAPVIKSDIIKKYLEQAKSRQELQKVQKLMALMDADPKNQTAEDRNQAAKLAKEIGLNFKAQTGSAGDTVHNSNKKEVSFLSKAIDWLRSPFAPGGVGDIKKADGGSIPFYQSGGLIPQSGPIYAHKGEVVIPAGFADGGLVENSSATAALKEGTIKLEDNGLADKIAEKIKEAIETSEIKIDEDATVKVDVTDVSVPVDVGDSKIQVDTTNVTVGVDSGQTTVPVDIASAADAIGDAISQALASASVDVNVNQVGGQAVGADGIDQVAQTVSDVQDKLITVKDELNTRIESVVSDIAITAQTEIAAQVEAAMTRVQQDINEHRNALSHVNGQITRFEHQMDHRIREVDRVAKDAQNLAQRPPSYSPQI